MPVVHQLLLLLVMLPILLVVSETTTRTYSATDACGNTAVCTQTIIRTVDVTPPSITCPATTYFICNAAGTCCRYYFWLLQLMPVVLQL